MCISNSSIILTVHLSQYFIKQKWGSLIGHGKVTSHDINHEYIGRTVICAYNHIIKLSQRNALPQNMTFLYFIALGSCNGMLSQSCLIDMHTTSKLKNKAHSFHLRKVRKRVGLTLQVLISNLSSADTFILLLLAPVIN